jgi:hypothetical protein
METCALHEILDLEAEEVDDYDEDDEDLKEGNKNNNL